ncbi:MAG: zinc protease [Algoriphagus sp.]|jgi:zinc protease
MINYDHFTLDNGLEVYLHQDKNTPMAAFNIVYNVGSRDEDENKTGFAHLFEHLMFGGSKNIKSYDEPLQRVGGENNAFTSPDITNYYITLPVDNIETAFWLESDRMMSLSFDPKVLEVQRKVVIEEFKQRYLSQPYGDVWLKLRPLAYKKHPYKWATIGKDVSHIENATMEDVKAFFYKHYLPNNATLVIAGNISLKEVKRLSVKWFSEIPPGEKRQKSLAQEPKQNKARFLETEAKVPLDALYKAYHMPGKYESNFQTADLISDVLGRGKSSRFYTALVKEKGLFNNLNAYVTASLDPGLLVVSGNLNEGVSIEEGNEAVENVIETMISSEMEAEELEKVKNQVEVSQQFSEVDLLNRAMNLAFAASYGNPELCNRGSEELLDISPGIFMAMAKDILRPENSNTMFYRASKN